MSLADIQRRLFELGFDAGPPDGVWGVKTERAVSEVLDKLTPELVVPVPAIAAARLVSQQPFAKRAIEGIVIHCTAGFEPHDAAGLRKMHMSPGWQGSKKGWSDIGYHYVVKLDGTIEAGRPEAQVGAHVAGHNTGTLGVVYVGGVNAQGQPKDTRTHAQKKALQEIVRALCVKYPKIAWVKGHNEFTDKKACPSFQVQKDPLSLIPDEF